MKFIYERYGKRKEKELHVCANICGFGYDILELTGHDVHQLMNLSEKQLKEWLCKISVRAYSKNQKIHPRKENL